MSEIERDVHRKVHASVRIMPLNIEIDVLEDETLMAAARRQGLRWPSICDGQGSCTVCYVKIDEGLSAAGPQLQWERDRLEFAGRRDSSFRLACQLKVLGPMQVLKAGVKLAEDHHRP